MKTLGAILCVVGALFFSGRVFGAASVMPIPSSLKAVGKKAEHSHSSESFFAIDLGTHFSQIEQWVNSPSGYGGAVSTLTGFLRIRPGFALGSGFSFEPSLAELLPWKSSADGDSQAFTTQLDLDFAIAIFSFLKLRLGPGLQWVLMTSSGDDVVLQNGTSNSTFSTPYYTSNAFIATVQGGFEIKFASFLSLNLDLFVLDLMSQSRRHYNGAASLGIIL